MRKTRLVVQPTRCLHTVGFLLLFMSCPTYGDWGLVQPESAAAQRAISLQREGARTLLKDPPGSRGVRQPDPTAWQRETEMTQRLNLGNERRWLEVRNQRLSEDSTRTIRPFRLSRQTELSSSGRRMENERRENSRQLSVQRRDEGSPEVIATRRLVRRETEADNRRATEGRKSRHYGREETRHSRFNRRLLKANEELVGRRSLSENRNVQRDEAHSTERRSEILSRRSSAFISRRDHDSTTRGDTEKRRKVTHQNNERRSSSLRRTEGLHLSRERDNVYQIQNEEPRALTSRRLVRSVTQAESRRDSRSRDSAPKERTEAVRLNRRLNRSDQRTVRSEKYNVDRNEHRVQRERSVRMAGVSSERSIERDSSRFTDLRENRGDRNERFITINRRSSEGNVEGRNIRRQSSVDSHRRTNELSRREARQSNLLFRREQGENLRATRGNNSDRRMDALRLNTERRNSERVGDASALNTRERNERATHSMQYRTLEERAENRDAARRLVRVQRSTSRNDNSQRETSKQSLTILKDISNVLDRSDSRQLVENRQSRRVGTNFRRETRREERTEDRNSMQRGKREIRQNRNEENFEASRMKSRANRLVEKSRNVSGQQGRREYFMERLNLGDRLETRRVSENQNNERREKSIIGNRSENRSERSVARNVREAFIKNSVRSDNQRNARETRVEVQRDNTPNVADYREKGVAFGKQSVMRISSLRERSSEEMLKPGKMYNQNRRNVREMIGMKPYNQDSVDRMLEDNSENWISFKKITENCLLGAIAFFVTTRNPKIAF